MKFYLVYVPLAIIATLLIIKYLNKKDNEKKYKFILILSFLGLLSHLIKPFFFPYNTYDMPDILRKITFENICAVSALIYPIVLLTKNKVLTDYITTIGLIGGLAAFLYPTEVILGLFDSMEVSYEIGLFAFDSIRFFFVHYIIFIVPFLLLYYRMHKFELERIFYFPIIIMGILTIIYLNEIALERLGWLNEVHTYFGRNIFYDVNIRNSSFVFGLSDGFKKIGIWIDILVPSVWKGSTYKPVIWILIPVIIYGLIMYYTFYKIQDIKLKKPLIIPSENVDTFN